MYRTVLGWAVSHSGRIYAKTNLNQSYATRRLTGVRLPKTPGWLASQLAQGLDPASFHYKLLADQDLFITENRGFIDTLAQLYGPGFVDYKGSLEEMLLHHADPHDKRELRIAAKEELCAEGRHDDPEDTWITLKGYVEWNMKPAEWAKNNKNPRMIVNLGVPASLRGFRLMEYAKVVQANNSVYIHGGEMQFIKSPDPFALDEVFAKLINPPLRYYFAYFSDDSCLAIRTNDGDVHRYNLDISGCDASHGPGIFSALVEMFPEHLRDEVRVLVRQCMAPLKVTSTTDRREKVLLEPYHPRLYSGSVITTFCNNLANLFICLSIVSQPYHSGLCAAAGAARAGYVVTGHEQPLSHPEELQFLKHSPILDTEGVYRPLLNLGVLLRASGVCLGDLPGKGDLQVRAGRFQAGLLRGAYPKANFTLLDNMRAACPFDDYFPCTYFERKVVDRADYPSFRVTDDSIARRYDLTPGEILELNETFGLATGFGFVFNGPSVSKILALDYGLTCVDVDHYIPDETLGFC